MAFTVSKITVERSEWDSNPRTTSLPPNGFQDRPLQPTWVSLHNRGTSPRQKITEKR